MLRTEKNQQKKEEVKQINSIIKLLQKVVHLKSIRT